MMSIWKSKPELSTLNHIARNTLVEHLGIQFIEIGDDFIKASMPVDRRTSQPYGLLHGGASVALAETLGSVGASLCVDPHSTQCVGLEINASHLRAVREGLVIGTARPLRLGKTLQVWEVRICDSKERLVCISRITLAVRDRRLA
jgi:1,4-dihydroxy-2-naphthoyl-CoA hydrolase